jgi:hypothetical protein
MAPDVRILHTETSAPYKTSSLPVWITCFRQEHLGPSAPRLRTSSLDTRGASIQTRAARTTNLFLATQPGSINWIDTAELEAAASPVIAFLQITGDTDATRGFVTS